MYRILIITCLLWFFTAPVQSSIVHRAVPPTVLYVAETGNDLDAGTIDNPLATLNGAIIKAKQSGSKTSVTILFRKGHYRIKQSGVLERIDADGGFSDYSIKNYNNEPVVFSGGATLEGKYFKPVHDPKVLSRLHVEATSHVYEIDLHQAGITNFGKRERFGYGTAVQPAPLEVFFNQTPMQIARWPNQGLLDIGEVLDPGSKPRYGDTSKRGAVFTMSDTRAKRWQKADDIWMYGYFCKSWADDNIKIASIDLNANTVKLSKPHLYGVEPSKTDTTHFRGYYVYNLLEEIDMPGEWFLDHSSGMLYLWPPNPINQSKIEVSQLEEPFIQILRSSHVNIEGITFECARGMGIYMNESNNCRISKCTFRNLGTVAISTGSTLTGRPSSQKVDAAQALLNAWGEKNYDNMIDECTIYGVGTGGIILNGGNRKTLIAGRNIVQNCEFYNFSRINHVYSPAVMLSGVGNVVRNCNIHDAPHVGIIFSGNNHLIEYNHFENICNIAHDMGAIYTGMDPSACGTVIQYNYFEHINTIDKRSVCSVYVDDGSGGINVFSNIFNNAVSVGAYQFGCVFVHGGKDNIMANNLFFNCAQAYGNSTFNDKRWKEFVTSPLMATRLYKDVDINSEVYKKAYPALSNFNDTTHLAIRKSITKNTLFFGKGTFSVGKNYLHQDSLTIPSEPELKNLESGRFKMVYGSIIKAKIPGFVPIPFERIGPLKNTY